MHYLVWFTYSESWRDEREKLFSGPVQKGSMLIKEHPSVFYMKNRKSWLAVDNGSAGPNSRARGIIEITSYIEVPDPKIAEELQYL